MKTGCKFTAFSAETVNKCHGVTSCSSYTETRPMQKCRTRTYGENTKSPKYHQPHDTVTPVNNWGSHGLAMVCQSGANHSGLFPRVKKEICSKSGRLLHCPPLDTAAFQSLAVPSYFSPQSNEEILCHINTTEQNIPLNLRFKHTGL